VKIAPNDFNGLSIPKMANSGFLRDHQNSAINISTELLSLFAIHSRLSVEEPAPAELICSKTMEISPSWPGLSLGIC